MNHDETLTALKHLLSLIEAEHTAQQGYALALEHLKNATDFYVTKLGAFDEANKPGYIAEKIGAEPIAPHGLIKLAVPVYLSRKKKYIDAKNFYDRAYPLAEAAYREKYSAERATLAAEDKVEQAEAIEKAQARVKMAKEDYDLAAQALAENNTLNRKFKEADIIQQLIEFFEEGRVETLKEAINLWYDEKRKDEEEERAEAHRQEFIALEAERVRAAQAAEEYARQAASDARDAAEMAHLNYVQNLCNTGKDSYHYFEDDEDD